VKTDEVMSQWSDVLSGIPRAQYLGLSCSLFTLMILLNRVGMMPKSLFADDARLYNHIKSRDDVVALQSKSDNVTNWSNKWLVMSFRHRQYDMKSHNYTYKMSDDILEHVVHIRILILDLIFLFDPLMPFDQHISNTVSKAYCMLRLMQRNF